MLLFPCIRNRVWASKVRFLIAGTEFPSSQSGRAVLFILGGETFHLFLRKKCFRRLFVLFLLTALLTWLTVPTAIVVMQLPAKEGFRLSHLEVQLKTKKGDTQLEYCIYIYIFIYLYTWSLWASRRYHQALAKTWGRPGSLSPSAILRYVVHL